jgi:hypothetical protein
MLRSIIWHINELPACKQDCIHKLKWGTHGLRDRCQAAYLFTRYDKPTATSHSHGKNFIMHV